MKTIVVGYDETEPAKRALEPAAELASAFGAKVIVTSIARKVVGKGIGPVDPADPPELHREELRHAAAFLAKRGLEGEYEVALGDPASEIVEVAETARRRSHRRRHARAESPRAAAWAERERRGAAQGALRCPHRPLRRGHTGAERRVSWIAATTRTS